MKILYISTSTIPSRTANSIHVMKMCQAFAKIGHEVVLFVPDRKDNVEPNVKDEFAFYGVERCFEIIRLPWLPITGRQSIYGYLAGRKAKKFAPDLTYGRNIAGCFFTTVFGLPVIFESHSPVKDSGLIKEWMFRKLIKSPLLRKIVVITHSLKNYYLNNYSLCFDEIQVAPDAADPVPEAITPVDLPNKDIRLQIGYTGHLYKGRGVDLIIKLAIYCDWADFHLVGGSEEDITYWKTKTDKVDNIFFHGFVSPWIAERIRISFDILIAPHQYSVAVADGGGNIVNWMSPLKIFEYMAVGKPIIASDLPALREVLVHGQNALLCPPEDIKKWKISLEWLRDDPEIRQKLGSAAYEDFLTKYTWQARAEKLV